MKPLNMLAASALIFCSTTAFSQSRDLGARNLILDDGAGNRLTISYAGGGTGTLVLPNGGGSVTPVGSTLNSTLRWSGSAWVENLTVLSGASGTLSTTGVLSTTSAIQGTGESTFPGDAQVTSLRLKTTNGGWDGFAVFGGANNAVVMGEVGTHAAMGGHNAALNVWTPLYINEGGSNVRIGSAVAPTSTLDVTGSLATTGAATLGDGADNISLNAGSGTFSLLSSAVDISTAGAISGATTVDASTAYRIGGVHALSLSGTGNTRLGFGASQVLTSGTYNTSLGFQAGRLLTSGFENTYVGTQAGDNNAAGNQNTIVGKDAGYASTGSGNSILGVAAGYNTTGNDNTFIGIASGFSNTSGTTNTYVGANSGGGAAFTNATALGNGATATASNQVMLGDGSVTQVTTAGAINTETAFTIGAENALRWNTVTSTLSVGISAASGSGNVFVGEGAGAVASGDNNVMIGNAAGVLSSATSDQNVIIGTTAGYQLNGDNNVALGGGEVGRNHNGDNSVFIGYAAGSHFAFGGPVADNNTMVGAETGRATSTGGSNTFLGYNSGSSNTTGNQNTYLGATSTGGAALDNATAVGYGATATSSNQVVLGNGSVTEVLTTGMLNAPSATLTNLQGAGVNKFAEKYLLTGGAAFEVVNNTLVTSSSVIVATLQSSAGEFVTGILPAAGSFTVYFNADPGAVNLNYIIVNP
jgi:trimeric autotransporter adhesin